jgi:YfiH family protein
VTATTNRIEAAKPLTHPLLDLPGIRHGFFTRLGGVSAGAYASLNCGVGSNDKRDLVLENRARAAAALGVAADRLATPFQIHSATAVTVTHVWRPGEGPKADAVVTDRPGVAVGVGSADCGPTLFADHEAGVVGAAHSGWRGAVGGVLESTIDAMEAIGADRSRIVAVLGPAISVANYEVGPDLITTFAKADSANARFFGPAARDGHAMFDLPAYIVSRLTSAGVKAASLGLCTYADPERFYSYRRMTHRGEADYGRLLSAIAITDGR